MKKYLNNHIRFIKDELTKENNNWSELLEFHRVQIGFLQHERLIHLLVTLFFGLMFFLTVLAGLLLAQFYWAILGIILLVVLIFYVWHYYCLENGVQKLYQLDKKIIEKQKNK
jgi:hypothetical protein